MFTQMARLGFDIDTKPIKDANRELERMPKAAGQAEKSARGMTSAMGLATRAIGVLGAALSVREALRYAEAWTNITNRLRLVTSTTAELVSAQQRIVAISQETRQPLEATAELYQRIAMHQKTLNLTSAELADITKTISQTMVISGTSAQGAQAALVQLGQAFASGVLRGEELNSVLEQAPALAQSIAAGMGVTVGQLRALGAEGKLTAEAVVDALQDQASAVEEQFNGMVPTVGQAMTTIGNSLMTLVGGLDEGMGASSALAGALLGVSSGLDSISESIQKADWTKWNSFVRESVYELSVFQNVLGATAAIIATGFGFGGLDNIKSILAALNSDLEKLKIDKVSDAIEELTDNTDLYGESAEALEKRMLANGDALLAYFAAQEKAVPITKEAAKAAKEAAKEAEAYAKSLQSLTDKLYPQKAAVRSLMEEYQLLVRAIKQGDAEASIVHDWLDAEVAIKSTHRAVKELADEADPFEEIWKNTTQRVQGWFADAFYDILDKGKVTFDGLLDMFKRMAAEMMAQKIMISFTGGGGGGGILGGLFGGGGGFGGGASVASGGGGFNILSAASWLNAGKTLWSGFSGMLAGEGLSGFSGIFGGGGFSMKGMMANMAAMWPMAVLLGMYQSGKLYDEGVRPDMGETWNSTNGNIIGQMGNLGPTVMSGIFDLMDKSLGGGKIAAILTGSTFHQALWNGINQAIWGGKYQTTRGGIQLGFGDEGFDPMQWERQTKKGGLFSSTKRRYRFSELDPETEQAFQDVYTATIDQVAGLYDIIGINIAEGALEAVRIEELKIGTAGKSEQTEEEIQEQIEQWFNSLTDAMVAAILPGMTREQLQAIATALAPLRALLSTDAAGGARADYALSSSPDRATRVYTQSADALRTMIGEYDGSVESINSLTQAMAMQQQLTYELTTAYLQVSDAVSILFGNLSENIRMSLMGAEELYEYQRQQVHSLADALATMTDPEQILATTQQIERLVSQLWSGLDDDQRQELGEGYLEFLDRAESLAQTRLSEGMKTVEQTQADLVSGMREQLALAASEMMQAALEQRQAAQMNLAAAEQMGLYLGQYGMNYAPEVNG